MLFKQADREGLTGRTGLAGWTGEKGEQAEFLDIIIDKIEVRRAGAFVARMWLSKKENFHKRACVRFVF